MYAETWMNFRNIMPRDRGQTQKESILYDSLICNANSFKWEKGRLVASSRKGGEREMCYKGARGISCGCWKSFVSWLWLSFHRCMQ